MDRQRASNAYICGFESYQGCQIMNTDIIILVWLHYVADFLFQSRKVGESKSGSNKVLLYHVTLYSIPFFWFGWQFAVLNAALHFGVDWCTSRVTKWAWMNNSMSVFWNTIGLDQAVHMTTLLLTYWWLIL